MATKKTNEQRRYLVRVTPEIMEEYNLKKQEIIMTFPVNEKGGLIIPENTWLLAEVDEDDKQKRKGIIPAHSVIHRGCDIGAGFHFQLGVEITGSRIGPHANFSHAKLTSVTVGYGANFNGRVIAHSCSIRHSAHIGYRKNSIFETCTLDQISTRHAVDVGSNNKFATFKNCMIFSYTNREGITRTSDLEDCLFIAESKTHTFNMESMITTNCRFTSTDEMAFVVGPNCVFNRPCIDASLDLVYGDVKIIKPSFYSNCKRISGKGNLDIHVGDDWVTTEYNFIAGEKDPVFCLPTFSITGDFSVKYGSQIPQFIIPNNLGDSDRKLVKLNVVKGREKSESVVGYYQLEPMSDEITLTSVRHGEGPVSINPIITIDKSTLRCVLEEPNISQEHIIDKEPF